MQFYTVIKILRELHENKTSERGIIRQAHRRKSSRNRKNHFTFCQTFRVASVGFCTDQRRSEDHSRMNWNFKSGKLKTCWWLRANLGREVTDDIGQVTTPKSVETLLSDGTLEAFRNTFVRLRQPSLLDHLILVLNQQFDTLNGRSRRFTHGSWDSSHQEIKDEAVRSFLCRCRSKHARPCWEAPRLVEDVGGALQGARLADQECLTACWIDMGSGWKRRCRSGDVRMGGGRGELCSEKGCARKVLEATRHSWPLGCHGADQESCRLSPAGDLVVLD